MGALTGGGEGSVLRKTGGQTLTLLPSVGDYVGDIEHTGGTLTIQATAGLVPTAKVGTITLNNSNGLNFRSDDSVDYGSNIVLDANVKNLLRTQDAYHDLDYGGGRKGFAMRAAGLGGPLDTATIPSPKGRYELLLVIDVPKGGPKEGKGTEAYRSLLMDYPVKLIEVVAKGIAERWR